MRVEVQLTNGGQVELEVEDEQEWHDFQNGEKKFATGWAQAMTGEWIRLSHVVSARLDD
jgi:hypothetical protein